MGPILIAALVVALLLDPLAVAVLVGLAALVTGLGLLLEAIYRRNDRRR